jgi:hypothetical protein
MDFLKKAASSMGGDKNNQQGGAPAQQGGQPAGQKQDYGDKGAYNNELHDERILHHPSRDSC